MYPLQVTELYLVDVATGADIVALTDGYVINKQALGAFSIRAEVCDESLVGSVRFYLNNQLEQNENIAPYAINGDNAAGFKPWNQAAGNYNLKATPFSGGSGNGSAGISKILSIVIVDSVVFDCNGDSSGTASIDQCGICSGGNTGLTPNATCTDCAGVPNGSAAIDACSVCAGGTTGITPDASCTDCAGIVNGSALVDACGICAGGTTGITIDSTCTDCNGVVNGTAVIDSCDDCVLGNTGSLFNAGCDIDCAGVVDGLAAIDSCGICAGGTTGITPDSSCTDCNGEVNGLAFIDNCSTCAGGSTGIIPDLACSDCAGVPNGTAITDSCNECVGGSTGLVFNATCADCNGDPNGTAYLDSCGICVGGLTGLLANADKDSCGVCFGNGQSCAPCQAIQVNDLMLVDATTNNDIGSLTNNYVIVKSSVGPFSVRADVCYPDSVESVRFFLDGNRIRNENVMPYTINGDNAGNYKSWNIAAGTYQLKAVPYSGNNGSGSAGVDLTITLIIEDSAPVADCNGDVGGTASFDQCGVCAGGNTRKTPNATCKDCAGVPNGLALIDACGVCAGGTTGNIPDSTCTDCAGVLNGTAMMDACGVCAGGTTGIIADATCTDCYGFVNGTAVIDSCGDCVLGTTGALFNAGCNIDCAGVVNGLAAIDACNICAGGSTGITPDSSCRDCFGVVNGTALIDACGICSGGTTGVSPNACVDCNGVAYGTAAVDTCGVCAGGNTGKTPNSSCGNSCVPNEVVSLRLMNTGNAGPIRVLNAVDTVIISNIGTFSIDALVCSDPAVESVKFKVNGSTERTENVAPYAIAGDNNGNYKSWNVSPGHYVIEAIPYSSNNANGVKGVSKTMDLWVLSNPPARSITGGSNEQTANMLVVDSKTGYADQDPVKRMITPATIPEPSMKVFPNPTTGETFLNIFDVYSESAELVLMDVTGKIIERIGLQSSNNEIRHELDLINLPDGVYLLRVNLGENVLTQKVIKE